MVSLIQIDHCRKLRADGWTHDDTCRRLQEEDGRIGGPSYMRAPDLLYHVVSSTSSAPMIPQPVKRGRFASHEIRQRLFDHLRVRPDSWLPFGTLAVDRQSGDQDDRLLVLMSDERMIDPTKQVAVFEGFEVVYDIQGGMHL